MAGQNHFTPWDYLTVVFTLGFSLFIGIYYACKKQTSDEMLVGGRNLGPLPIAASMLVTYLSAITILGYPAEIYAFGMQIFSLTIINACLVPVSAYLFVKTFYNMKLTSVYEYLEKRFDSVLVRLVTSFVFILQVVMISGIILFAPCIALKGIVGLPVWISLLGIGICGTVYTTLGGLKAVVFTDCFQFIMILIGMMAITVKGFISSGGIANAFQLADEGGRLQIFHFSVDFFERHNFLNILLGYGFAIMSLYGTHQPQVQRYSSLPSLNDAYKAIAFSIPMNIFVMIMVAFTGISIYATFAGCDPIKLGHIHRADAIVPYFVVKELYSIPGMMGLFISCIFSAVLSSISSALNSLAAVTQIDFLDRISYFKNMGESGKSHTTRALTCFYGILVIILGFVAQNLGAIFQATITAVGATSGTLGGVFILGLFMPCVNKYGALSGMATSLLIMLYIAINAFFLNYRKPFNIPLPTSIDACPDYLLEQMSPAQINRTLQMEAAEAPEIEWPEKLYTLSYILYSFVGAVICVVVGVIVSLITGGCKTSKNVDRDHLHTLLYSTCCVGPPKPKPCQANLIMSPTKVDRLSYNYHRVNSNETNGKNYIYDDKSNV